jgi:uncharacterized membrane protein YgaE (UPF0421/DUF939 family)
VDLAVNTKDSYAFDPVEEETESKKQTAFPTVIFINVLKVFLWVIGIASAVALVIFLIRLYRNYSVRHPNNRRSWKKERKKHHSYSQSRSSTQLTRRREAIKQAKRRQRKSKLHNNKAVRQDRNLEL